MRNLGKNANGIPFNSRIVRKGEKYGLNFCLTHEESEPLVEFYDARFDHTKFGQFVSRYYVTTLTGECEWSHGDSRKTGICLDGGVPDWFVDANQVCLALSEV